MQGFADAHIAFAEMMHRRRQEHAQVPSPLRSTEEDVAAATANTCGGCGESHPSSSPDQVSQVSPEWQVVFRDGEAIASGAVQITSELPSQGYEPCEEDSVDESLPVRPSQGDLSDVDRSVPNVAATYEALLRRLASNDMPGFLRLVQRLETGEVKSNWMLVALSLQNGVLTYRDAPLFFEALN